ncbi:MAG: zinc metallopeptidase [Aquincola sp.]|nr:zinc metallopeptidase [Aquincola sp.]
MRRSGPDPFSTPPPGHSTEKDRSQIALGWLQDLGCGSEPGAKRSVHLQQALRVRRCVRPTCRRSSMAGFVSTVLADTEEVWGRIMQGAGSRYAQPKLVLFRGAVGTACGTGQSAMGPFYCPGDQKVYLDMGFFETLRARMGAPGDFAQAYVIAHEVAHHVQNQLGITGKVDALRGRVSEQEMNALSVRVELQADCFAGVWAHHSQKSKGWLERGDIEEALNAAAQIGDDNIQRKTQGTIVPESFTHGSSQQRMTWFKRGLESGSVQQCNTFEGRL